MTRGRSRRVVAVAFALGALLFAAALLLPERWSAGDGGRGGDSLAPDFPRFFDLLLVALALALFVAGAVVLVALSLRRDPSAPVRRKGPAGALVALVVLALAAALIAAYGPGAEDDLPRSSVNVERADGSGGEGASGDGGGSAALGALVTLVVVLLVVGAPVAAWRFARARVPETIRTEAFDERLLEEVDQGIADLETIGDPRAAVIACYGRLQRLARWSGLQVRASDTASDLLGALARRSEAVEPSAARLVALFQTARFSPHALGESDRADAITALSEIRERLVVPV